MFSVTFGTWLDNELAQRKWNRAELARRGGFNHSALSNIYAGRRKPGVDICEDIARALNLPLEQVYRAAGLLPPNPNVDPLIDEGIYLLKQLEGDDLTEALSYLKYRREVQESRGNQRAVHKRQEKPATTG